MEHLPKSNEIADTECTQIVLQGVVRELQRLADQIEGERLTLIGVGFRVKDILGMIEEACSDADQLPDHQD